MIYLFDIIPICIYLNAVDFDTSNCTETTNANFPSKSNTGFIANVYTYKLYIRK